METIEKGQYRARIEYDEGFELDMLGDRVGKFYTGKRAADYGFPNDVVLYPDSDGTTKFDADEFEFAAPVYGLSHSGMSVSLGSFGDPWDSAQIGYYAIDRHCAEQWFGSDYTEEQLRQAAEAEVAEMDKVLRGEVFYVVVEKQNDCDSCGNEDWEIAESCGGFVGYTHARTEAESMLSVHAS